MLLNFVSLTVCHDDSLLGFTIGRVNGHLQVNFSVSATCYMNREPALQVVGLSVELGEEARLGNNRHSIWPHWSNVGCVVGFPCSVGNHVVCAALTSPVPGIKVIELCISCECLNRCC